MKCFGKDRQGRHTFPTDVPHFLNTCYMLLIKKNSAIFHRRHHYDYSSIFNGSYTFPFNDFYVTVTLIFNGFNKACMFK